MYSLYKKLNKWFDFDLASAHDFVFFPSHIVVSKCINVFSELWEKLNINQYISVTISVYLVQSYLYWLPADREPTSGWLVVAKISQDNNF